MTLDQRLAWVDFSFNLGHAKTQQFKKTISHLNKHEWQLAAAQMKKSKWAKQVGRRSNRITAMIAGEKVVK